MRVGLSSFLATPLAKLLARRPASPQAIQRVTRLAILLVSLCVMASVAGAAQDDSVANTYITPFPIGDVYKVQVLGDALAEGVIHGLVEALGSDKRLDIIRKPVVLEGLLAGDFAARVTQIDEGLTKEPAHVAILMLGTQDRVSWKGPGGRAAVGSAEWRSEYDRRTERILQIFKKHAVAVYWISQPSLRRSEANDDAQMMNEIIRERVYLSGFKYVDAFTGFADEGGGYSSYGPDITGKIRLLRDADGVGFTEAGNRKLAHFVERELRRDLTQAVGSRTIPLAGSEAEQARISPTKQEARGGGPGAEGQAGARSPGGSSAQRAGASTASPVAQGSGHGDEKVDNGQVSLKLVSQSGREETVAIEILRPAIPASVLSLVTRRESNDKAAQHGDTLVDQIPGGLTVMSSIQPSDDAGAARGKQSPTQTPYFRVMVKGERLMPRPGRADDFSWPRAGSPGQAQGEAQLPASSEPAAPAAAPVQAPAPPVSAPPKG